MAGQQASSQFNFGAYAQASESAKPKKKKSKKASKSGSSKVTLAGLLNTLDGVSSKEARITIMSSNCPDSLDPALIRPGRIDAKILFDFASHEMCEELFRRTISHETAKARAGRDPELDKHAKAFADIVGSKKEFTPAEVSGYLIPRRSQAPKLAVDGAPEFVRVTRDVKLNGLQGETTGSKKASMPTFRNTGAETPSGPSTKVEPKVESTVSAKSPSSPLTKIEPKAETTVSSEGPSSPLTVLEPKPWRTASVEGPQPSSTELPSNGKSATTMEESVIDAKSRSSSVSSDDSLDAIVDEWF